MPARKFAACVSRIVAVLLSALCLVLFCVERSAAQHATALLTGTIKDFTGAGVPGAKVTLKNSDTNIARTETSNKDGDFLFTLVPIGSYQVEVTSEGFRRYVHKGITLEKRTRL